MHQKKVNSFCNLLMQWHTQAHFGRIQKDPAKPGRSSFYLFPQQSLNHLVPISKKAAKQPPVQWGDGCRDRWMAVASS